ncbi:hypothetical protein [Sphingomonas paucimobilis]|uniref:Uncharacterized protein n=1 Tax=Sphingomonas paucimobilis TaxID=13689 RepID=A0A7T3ABU3_SPHPI|nr:hypothetical protein [Sphingomonas paucimobilis]QPT09735.1 hypothetical protein I6G38_05645 [Sphingomonas paucimobilis]
MTRRSSQRWMAIALPIVAGLAILALGLVLMPGRREVEQAARRAAPPVPPVVPPQATPTAAPVPPSARHIPNSVPRS